MKKLFAIALAIAIMMSLALPVAAATSSASGSTEELAPTVVAPAAPAEEKEEEPVLAAEGLEIVTADAAEEMTEEEQKTFADAKEALTEAAPEGFAVKYFFFVKVEKAGDATLKVEDFEELKVMQFVDGKWVELEFVVNADGTITVKNVGNGPLAICTK